MLLLLTTALQKLEIRIAIASNYDSGVARKTGLSSKSNGSATSGQLFEVGSFEMIDTNCA